MYKVGLIGYGAFGKALTEWLKPYCEFTIFDIVERPDNVRLALQQPIIILAIPAQYLDSFLEEHQSELNPDAIYIDVCSVKVGPISVMKQRLPESAAIIATHPAFGPESAKHGLQHQKIMTFPVRVANKTYKIFLDFLTRLELQIIETSPEQHDRDMAYIQGLSHYVGRIMQALDIPELALNTRAYRDLLDMKNIQGNDSDDLFYSIVHSNPYTIALLQEFKAASKQVDSKFEL